MTIRIRTKIAGCVGHARCAAVAPNIFELDDDGFNTTELREVDESMREDAVRGVRGCPEKIISIEED